MLVSHCRTGTGPAPSHRSPEHPSPAAFARRPPGAEQEAAGFSPLQLEVKIKRALGVSWCNSAFLQRNRCLSRVRYLLASTTDCFPFPLQRPAGF